ncbi:T9SS type A sorting domain-containing protein [Prevotella sp. kh1p2]|uniref:T9SS type A sorting domain-containing protein n=1 Tax=Prevotella sp. kh1p2 TaxID=1761883 RepID=UPI0008CF23D7|nr:T9SS type A sorting domain-containing protein [Prevotella sp. kh1p2]SET14271.1 Por secretion system C-terminal sorting domain-containing protein [Prevotella sp. kh1p2]SNU12002.1 Por secretion system C-terminal sorting domain-containing protein [Prevotellaceae bacterium KH2P17]
MNRFIISLFLLIPALAWAGTEDKVLVINGNRAEKKVIRIGFNNDSVTLFWNDQTKTSSSIDRVMMRLASAQGIDKACITSVCGLYADHLFVQGLATNTPLSIYDMHGKLMLQMPVSDKTTQIEIGNLNTGIYLLSQDNVVVKFIKQ